MSMKNIIYINDDECIWDGGDLWMYKDQYLTFVRELNDGSDEMAYCDKNGKIIPDSPTVICLPGMTDAECIQIVE